MLEGVISIYLLLKENVTFFYFAGLLLCRKGVEPFLYFYFEPAIINQSSVEMVNTTSLLHFSHLIN